MSKPTIVVAGATGNSGSFALAALAESNQANVVALARDPSKVKELPNTKVVKADFTDKASLDAALAGADRAFLVCAAGSPEQSTYEINFLKAAFAAGVKVVVRISTCNPLISEETECVYANCHAQIEKYVAENDLFVIDLNPDWFLANQYLNAPEAKATGKISIPLKDIDSVKYAFIHGKDIGGAAAALLLQPEENLAQFKGKHLELHGPGEHTFGEVTAAIAKEAGYPIENQSVPAEGFQGALIGAGFPEPLAKGFTLTYLTLGDEAKRYRPFTTKTDPKLLKIYTPSVTLADFAKEVAPAFKKE